MEMGVGFPDTVCHILIPNCHLLLNKEKKPSFSDSEAQIVRESNQLDYN